MTFDPVDLKVGRVYPAQGHADDKHLTMPDMPDFKPVMAARGHRGEIRVNQLADNITEPPLLDSLRVFICTDHDLVWPVGCASVVLAESEAHARELLDKQLRQHGLKGHDEEPYTLTEISGPCAVILNDGNY